MASNVVETLMLEWVRRNWKLCYDETPEIARELSNLFGAENCLGFILSEEIGSNDPLSVLSLEIEADIQVSTLLAMSGFYRHANLALRSPLTLAFASVWFSFNRAEFDKWMNRDLKAPFQHDGVMEKRVLAELMTKSKSLAWAESEFNLITSSMDLFVELCDFVHARGESALDMTSRGDSVPHFYPEHTGTWFQRLLKIFGTWVTLVFARYPTLLDMERHPKEKMEILSTIPGDVKTKLESTRNGDPV